MQYLHNPPTLISRPFTLVGWSHRRFTRHVLRQTTDLEFDKLNNIHKVEELTSKLRRTSLTLEETERNKGWFRYVDYLIYC